MTDLIIYLVTVIVLALVALPCLAVFDKQPNTDEKRFYFLIMALTPIVSIGVIVVALVVLALQMTGLVNDEPPNEPL